MAEYEGANEITGTINVILHDLIEGKASSVTVRPVEKKIFYYIAGKREESGISLDGSLYEGMTSRIKLMSGIDLSEQSRVMRGKMKIHGHEFRVLSNPSTDGPYITMREEGSRS